LPLLPGSSSATTSAIRSLTPTATTFISWPTASVSPRPRTADSAPPGYAHGSDMPLTPVLQR
jgi:hypothetical protein